MSTPHLRPLAVAFGKAWRLAGPNPANDNNGNDSTEREV